MPQLSEQNQTSKALALASTIKSANQLISRLLTLLTEEREALATGNLESIDACGRHKADCVVDLEHLDQQRSALCSELALDSKDIDAFLSEHQSTPKEFTWQTFLTNLEACKEANAINGAFTRIRRGHIERALNILRGAPETLALYGPDGLKDAKHASTLGQA